MLSGNKSQYIMNTNNISKRQLERFPIYLKLLNSLNEKGIEIISSPQIADYLGYSEEQVRKDLQDVSSSFGKPKQGRKVVDLIKDISSFLGYNEISNAILVGVGHLGQALLNYEGFKEEGLRLVAGFDVNKDIIGTTINETPIYDLSLLEKIIKDEHIEIAIIATPSNAAFNIANKLKECGIKAIWNFAHIHLNLGENVIVENVNLASSLAILSHQLKTNK